MIARHFDTTSIEAALAVIPGNLRRMAGLEIVAGIDPVWCGLSRFTDTDDGRSYRDTAHVLWPIHLLHLPAENRAPRLVLPRAVTPDIVVHEFGHVLHWYLDLDTKPTFAPVTRYAATNRYEAFAEAFAAWLCPDVYHDAQDALAVSGAPEFFGALP